MKVAIIGGAGKMGRWFTRYFIKHEHEVIIYDIDEENARKIVRKWGIRLAHSNSEAAKLGDLIVICTPINVVPKVLEEIRESLSQSAAVMEISSVKSPVMSILRRISSSGIRVLSVHPLFGPGIEDPSGEKMALVPVHNVSSEISLAENLFPSMKILPIDLEKHDYIMALTLSLTHFINIVLASVLAKENLRELKNLGGTTFTMQLLISESIMSEDPNLCTSIQMSNPYTIQYLERFLSEAEKLMRHIHDEDVKKFSEFYREASSALSKYENLSDAYENMYRVLRALRNSEMNTSNP